MENNYTWALNPSKLERALDLTNRKGTEAEVKAEYIKLGGKVPLANIPVVPEVVEEVKTNDTTPNNEVNSPVEESELIDGGTDSINDSVADEA